MSLFNKLSKLSAHTGYLMIDHRDSPGVPDELIAAAIAAGKPAMPSLSGGSLFEADTFTCAHCSAIIIKNQLRTRGRHYCSKCDRYVCDNPLCGLECNPFKQQLDELHHLATGGNQPLLLP